ncbi:MAG: response regulator transcription factor [Bacteroidaceae bacterium]
MITKIVLLTDSVIIAEGIKQLLVDSPHFKIVATCATLDRAEQSVILHQATMLILDPRIIDYSRRSSVRHLFHDTVLVALTLHYAEQELLRQYNGIIEITSSRKEMEKTLQVALQRYTTINDTVDIDNYELSKRETEVLIGLANGLQNKEIAENLCISVHTVVSHRKNIIEKTGIKSVAGLTVYALMKNLIDGDDVI